MKDYLLFIDTEATGLPKNWSLPYTAPGNWPSAVQVAWVIYSKDGKKIWEQNHFISNNDFTISSAAMRIHGLNKEFLQQHGLPRRQVLAILSKDILQYQPMIVGHFIELDYRIIGADFSREGMDNPMEKLPVFCIMIASKHLQQNPQTKFLRLGDLYNLLFAKPLAGQHNALVDAVATADCFFEMVKRNEICSFTQPPVAFPKEEKVISRFVWLIALLLVLISVLLIAFYNG